MARGRGIPLEDECFCVGPDARLPLWYGRRSQLDVDRGQCTPLSAFYYYYALEPADNYRRKLWSSARRGSPRGTSLSGAVRSTALAVPPFRCERREGYQCQEQSPSDHIQNLNAISSSCRPPSLGTPPSAISASAIQTFWRAISSFQGRLTLTDKSSACSTGNTPPSCPRFSFPAYPIASKTVMILSRNP